MSLYHTPRSASFSLRNARRWASLEVTAADEHQSVGSMRPEDRPLLSRQMWRDFVYRTHLPSYTPSHSPWPSGKLLHTLHNTFTIAVLRGLF